MKALVTGSGGLVGSECVKLLAEHGWEVLGVDSNMRRVFFGEEGSTEHVIRELSGTLGAYRHHNIDIRDREGIRKLLASERPDFIIHAAAQPSHDRAAAIPYLDFDVNAVGTVNLLVAARDYCPDSPFCFISTNKVYGDHPNRISLDERETRYEYADGREGIDETFPIDQGLHSVFGASKVAADVMCQEFGLYFGMPVGVFRASCLTGPQHAAVSLHGYLTYIVMCAVQGRPYTILGHKGKQVRDQLHCRDVASLFLHFYRSPRAGEVYNVGGGRRNSLSILETIQILGEMGYELNYRYSEQARKGDHICYISDLAKTHSHFPAWEVRFDARAIIEQIVDHCRREDRKMRATR